MSHWDRLRVGIEPKEPKPGEILDCNAMRRAIDEAKYESALVGNAMRTADFNGLSAEDRYTILAYHALVSLEIYYKQALEISMRYPNPPILYADKSEEKPE
jgi:hypothetical protein